MSAFACWLSLKTDQKQEQKLGRLITLPAVLIPVLCITGTWLLLASKSSLYEAGQEVIFGVVVGGAMALIVFFGFMKRKLKR